MSPPTVLDPRSQIVFVLDRPREPANVGAVVRLLGNVGLSRLRLVEPAAFDEDQARRMARRGASVLAAVERYAVLEDALADCVYVLGTTRRARTLDRPVLSPRAAAPALLAVAGAIRDVAGRTAAVLFGPEDFGLSNTALDRCHAILTIPTVPHDASLNLAQAALLIAYELHLAASADSPLEPRIAAEPGLATGSDLERMFDAARRMLVALHSPPIEGRTNSTLARLRALLLRAAPKSDEARLLTGIFEHVAHDYQVHTPEMPATE